MTSQIKRILLSKVRKKIIMRFVRRGHNEFIDRIPMMRSHNLSSICQTCLSLLALKEIAMLPWVFVRKETYLTYSRYPNHLYNQQFRNESSHLIIYQFKNSSNIPYRIWLVVRIWFTQLQLYEKALIIILSRYSLWG